MQESLIVDLGQLVDVTGFIIRTKNIQKLQVVPGILLPNGERKFQPENKLVWICKTLSTK